MNNLFRTRAGARTRELLILKSTYKRKEEKQKCKQTIIRVTSYAKVFLQVRACAPVTSALIYVRNIITVRQYLLFS